MIVLIRGDLSGVGVVRLPAPTVVVVRPGLIGQGSAEAVVPAGVCWVGWEGLNVK